MYQERVASALVCNVKGNIELCKADAGFFSSSQDFLNLLIHFNRVAKSSADRLGDANAGDTRFARLRVRC